MPSECGIGCGEKSRVFESEGHALDNRSAVMSRESYAADEPAGTGLAALQPAGLHVPCHDLPVNTVDRRDEKGTATLLADTDDVAGQARTHFKVA